MLEENRRIQRTSTIVKFIVDSSRPHSRNHLITRTLGKIGVIVELTGGTAEQGKDVAMQVAAAKPSCVDRSSVDQKDLDHEREVLRKQALEEGKPEKIVEKMVDGRINK